MLGNAPTGSLQTALANAQRLLRVDPVLAGQQASEILVTLKGHPEATLLLATSHRLRGQHAQAVESLAALAASRPQWTAAQHELQRALAAAGQSKAVIAALRHATRARPELAESWRWLADCLAASGDAAQAELARSQMAYCVRHPELLAAANAMDEGRVGDAEKALRRHLSHIPKDVAALRLLALVALRCGQVHDADALLSRCLQFAPDFRAARESHAIALNELDRPQQALEHLEVLLQGEPNHPGYCNLKALMLARIGDHAGAGELCRNLLRDHPDHTRLWLSYGHALKAVGDTDAAVSAYRRAVTQTPYFGEAWWSLANLKTFRFSHDDASTMQAQLQRPRLNAEHRTHLEFALGKEREDAGDHAAAFAHYKHGNDLRHSQVRHDTRVTSARLQQVRRQPSRGSFAAHPGSGIEAADPIFLVGLPRSGSTLVEQILASHSAVESTMELQEFPALVRELRQRQGGDHDALALPDPASLLWLGEHYLQRTRLYRQAGTPRFIDKLPGNFLHVGLIHLALPNARVIDVRRHPMACGFSLFKQLFVRGNEFSYRLGDIGCYYRDYVALMTHFDEMLPGRVHRLVYDDLIDDFETQVRRLLDHCGLAFEPACLRFFENPRPVRTASSEQVRHPLFRNGLEQWRHYEAWLQPLQAALGPALADWRCPYDPLNHYNAQFLARHGLPPTRE